MLVNFKNIKGNPLGKKLISAIILDEDDLSGCQVQMWRGDSLEEVCEALVAEGYDEQYLVIEEQGTIE